MTDETCARCDRRICVCMYDKAPVEGTWPRHCDICGNRNDEHKGDACPPLPAAGRQVDPDAPGWTSARDTVATGDRVVDECARARRRMLGDTIVDDEESPVASAARVSFRLGWEAAHAARPAVADAVMADLGAAITEGVTEARLVDLITSLYAGARDQRWQEAADLAEMVSGDPWNDVDLMRFRTWLSERLR